MESTVDVPPNPRKSQSFVRTRVCATACLAQRRKTAHPRRSDICDSREGLITEGRRRRRWMQQEMCGNERDERSRASQRCATLVRGRNTEHSVLEHVDTVTYREIVRGRIFRPYLEKSRRPLHPFFVLRRRANLEERCVSGEHALLVVHTAERRELLAVHAAERQRFAGTPPR